VKMAVIDLKSGNQQSHPLTSEGFSLGQSNLARDVKNMCIHVRRHIDPMIEGFARHDQCVTVSDRSQCHPLMMREKSVVMSVVVLMCGISRVVRTAN